jgi:serine protease
MSDEKTRRRSSARRKPPDRGKRPPAFLPRIAVKFAERFALPKSDRPRLDYWNGLLVRGLGDEFGALELLPLIESLSPEKLAGLIDRAREIDPSYDPARFDLWFQVVCPANVDANVLAKRLSALDAVEMAYVMRPGPPPVNPTDDPRFLNQGYLKAAPNGIDAEYAWGFLGGDGAGVGWVDMEQGWNLNHEDLSAAGISLISGVSNDYIRHGTAVIGEIGMVDNTLGGVGVAPQAAGRVISQWRTAESFNTADAILDAAANMAFGDVLLLEAHEYDPKSSGSTPYNDAYYWPVEIVDANYDAISLATALGIVVIEAAGNGPHDLDAYLSPSGARIFDRSSKDFRDSGAIMVGAASAATPHVRLDFSNYGSRIDCYAWGESIDTTATNLEGTDNASYVTYFGGTSGASPIVAGAAVIVQAIAEKTLGYRFTPKELRQIIAIDGTPSANPAVDRIGVMPDLRAIISGNRINLAPDLYLRDHVGDTGDPTVGTVSLSPDIILRQIAVPHPGAAFGEGSGTENDPALSDPVATGIDHSIYVRVLNRGGSPATNVSVDVYWSPPATLVSPTLWNKIGTATLASVPPGNKLRVLDAITWLATDIPAPGHYCFVGVAGTPEDPAPGPAAFANFEQFRTFVRTNNNVAWRNFNVEKGGPPSAKGFYEMLFLIVGPFDTTRRFELESLGALPSGSQVFLEVPNWLAETFQVNHVKAKERHRRGRARIPLNPCGSRRLGPFSLHKDARADCRLRVSMEKRELEGGYDFAIRQLYENDEVGRVTWRFVPAAN